MPTAEPQRLPPGTGRAPRKRSARKRLPPGTPVQPWSRDVFSAPGQRRYSPYALALTLFVHLIPLLLLLLAPELLTPLEEPEVRKSTKVELVPPPFVQINPFANQQRIRTAQEGAQNQQAAQETEPDPDSRAEGPQLQGEDPRFNRIISGNPEAPDVAPAPLTKEGDSDTPKPPAAGTLAQASPSNSFQLQTRSEYLRQQAEARAAQAQETTATPQGTPATAQNETAAQHAEATPQHSAATAQQPDAAAQALPHPNVSQPQSQTPQTAQRQPEPPQSAPQITARQEAELADEGLAQDELPTQEPAATTEQTPPTEISPNEETTPAEEMPPTEEVMPAAPAEQTAPLEEIPPVEQTIPAEAIPPVEQAMPIEQSPPIEQAMPAEENALPQQAPADEASAMPPAQPLPQGTEATPAIDPDAPRPRPTIEPRLSAGPLRHQAIAANTRGMIAIDSRFSEFGAYQQRMVEAISAQWYMLARQSRAIDSEYGTQVVLEFTMDDQGIVSDNRVRFTNASAAATLLCINAVESRSPFGAWTSDMKRVLGDKQTVTFTFYYR